MIRDKRNYEFYHAVTPMVKPRGIIYKGTEVRDQGAGKAEMHGITAAFKLSPRPSLNYRL